MNRERPRILVTGANGLIGSQFVKLPAKDVDMIYSSKSEGRFSFDGEFRQFDFTNIDQISEFLSEVNPSVIVHTAGVTAIEYAAENENETQLLNVEATEQMVRWCQSRGRKLVYFSTDFVFDGTLDEYSELNSPNPLSTYGRSKALAEETILSASIDAAIVRTSLVYGHNENLARPNFPIWLMTALTQAEEVFITADQIRSPTYAFDLALATRILALSDLKGVYHIAGPESMNVFEFALHIAEEFGLDKEKIKATTSSHGSDAKRRPLKTALDISKAKRDIDFVPRTVKDGLKALRIEMP